MPTADAWKKLLEVAVMVLIFISVSPFLIPALLTLFAFRLSVVFLWSEFSHTLAQEERMVIFWLRELPAILSIFTFTAFMFGFAAIDNRSGLALPGNLLLLSLSSVLLTLGIVASYFYFYFRAPPSHPNWLIFLAAHERLNMSFNLYWVTDVALPIKLLIQLWIEEFRKNQEDDDDELL